MPSRLPPELRSSLETIRLLILDVDGVLTDGSLVYGAGGEAYKVFNARDGLGIRILLDEGLQVGVISGRSHPAVLTRMLELGCEEKMIILGSRDKNKDLKRLQELAACGDQETAAVGDDLSDLPMLLKAGFSACPADASPDVAAFCDYVCGSRGGRGVVREVAERIPKGRGRGSELLAAWKN